MVPIKSLQNSTSLTPDLPIFDNWEGCITMLPYGPSSEESAMGQLDEFIDTQLSLVTKNGPIRVEVISRKRFSDGTLVVIKHDNPELDSRLYNIKSPGGYFE